MVAVRPPPIGYWALAPTLAQLRREIIGAYPAMLRAPFGTIGDLNHAARKSDHNPDQKRYVRALDVPYVQHGGVPLDLLAEFIRRVGEGQSQRLIPSGYVVFNRRVASTRSSWRWTTYMGESPHLTHVHLSCSLLPHLYCLEQSWRLQENLARMV